MTADNGNALRLYGRAYQRASGLGYSLPTPTKLDAFDVENFTIVNAAATKALDATNKIEGSGAVVVTGPGVSGTIGLDKTYGSYDMSKLGTLAVWASRLTAASVSSLQLALHRSAITSTLTFSNEASYLQGGRWLAANISEWPTVKVAGTGSLRTRELVNPVTPFSAQVAFDALYCNAEGRPTVVLTFDDLFAEHYNNVFPLMKRYGFKGTLLVPTNNIGGATRMTLAQLQEMYAAGFDISINSSNDLAWTTYSTAAAVADAQATVSYLSANGMTRGNTTLCWPNSTQAQAHADAFFAAGFQAIRGGATSESFHDRFGAGLGLLKAIPSRGFSSSAALTQGTDRLTEIKLRGTTQFFHFHDISASPSSIGWQLSKFTSFLNALKLDYEANLVDVLTVSQWYTRQAAGTPP